MTGLETSLLGLTGGIIGFTIRAIISSKVHVRKDLCNIVHEGVEKTLTRIEAKLDKLNGE